MRERRPFACAAVAFPVPGVRSKTCMHAFLRRTSTSRSDATLRPLPCRAARFRTLGSLPSATATAAKNAVRHHPPCPPQPLARPHATCIARARLRRALWRIRTHCDAGTSWRRAELNEDWCGYDEDGDCSVEVMELEHTIVQEARALRVAGARAVGG